MKNYVYRGVRHTKDDQATINATVAHRNNDAKKVYRGVKAFDTPRWHHLIVDHVYRGAHYMA